jgi:surfactin synthase thioesterase subunit
VSPLFKKEYPTFVLGHSLFSVAAEELAALFATNGFLVRKMVVFGQPKANNKESLAKLDSKVPIIRVTDIRDPVAALFPKHKHVPAVDVILLADKFHTNLGQCD